MLPAGHIFSTPAFGVKTVPHSSVPRPFHGDLATVQISLPRPTP
jgi:hypothetical protein